MKVLFLNPPRMKENVYIDPILTRCTGVPAKAPYLLPPIGLAYVAGYVEDMADVKILDAQAEDLDISQTARKCKNFDLVVFNFGTVTADRDLKLCEEIKANSSAEIALVGTHSTFFHSQLVQDNSVDFVIRGEPEKIIYNLISNKPEKVKGLTWKHKGKIKVNKRELPIENLDSAPFAARNLLPNDKYYDILTRKSPITLMITSRGCPFNCTFCTARIYNGRIYRYRSAENVVKEVEEVIEQGFRDITFFDDTFTINRERVIKICRLIKDFGVSWRCLSRIDGVDKEMLKKMYDSGCYKIEFGVESGDQNILNKMKKGVNINDVKKVFKWCDEIGIETVGFFVLGYSGETKKSIEKTFKLVEEIKPDFVTFNLMMPLPGSEIYDVLKPKESWDKFDFTSTSFCDIPSEEMQKIIAKAYKNYYIRPQYLFRRIWKTKDPIRIIRQNILFWLKRSGVMWRFLRK